MLYDLTDFEWSVIEPLPPNKPRGWVDMSELVAQFPRAPAGDVIALTAREVFDAGRIAVSIRTSRICCNV